MPTFLIAFLITIGTAALCDIILSLLAVPKEIAIAMSGSIFGSLPFLKEAMDRWQEKRTKAGSPILSYEGYGISFWRTLVYAYALFFSSMELVGVAGGISAAIDSEASFGNFMEHAALMTIVIAYPLTFLIARWMGRRNISHGAWATLIAVLLAFLTDTMLPYLLGDSGFSHAWEALVGNTRMEFIKFRLLGAIPFVIIAWIGFFWGRRQQLSGYISYLFRQVSPEARATIVDLVYQEAKLRVSVS